MDGCWSSLNGESTETSDSRGFAGVKSIEDSEIFSQLFSRLTMSTCIPAFGYCRDGDSLIACISADGGSTWLVAGSNSEDTSNVAGSSLNGEFMGIPVEPLGDALLDIGDELKNHSLLFFFFLAIYKLIDFECKTSVGF